MMPQPVASEIVKTWGHRPHRTHPSTALGTIWRTATRPPSLPVKPVQESTIQRPRWFQQEISSAAIFCARKKTHPLSEWTGRD